MYEHKKDRLIPRPLFLKRLACSIGTAILLAGFSLGMGMLGYHELENLSWIDSYLEATMILSGMGPSATLQTDAGKLFAGTYALYSGLILIITIGVIIAPIAHRFFHKFHLDIGEKE